MYKNNFELCWIIKMLNFQILKQQQIIINQDKLLDTLYLSKVKFKPKPKIKSKLSKINISIPHVYKYK